MYEYEGNKRDYFINVQLFAEQYRTVPAPAHTGETALTLHSIFSLWRNGKL